MSVFAAEIAITPNVSELPISNQIEYYEDRSELLSIDDVLAPSFDVNFIPQRRDIVHFGLTSSAYWLRFNLDWSGVSDATHRILEFGPPPRSLLT